MVEYTREHLISILERAIVPQKDWHDRDSYSAQCQAGEALQLLKAGCEFWLNPNANMQTTDRTIWIGIKAQGFAYHDYGGDEDEETYYLPTEAHLKEAAGGDWY